MVTTNSGNEPNKPQSGNIFSRLAKKLAVRLSSLFEPEEVEVTFKVEGKNVTYTYTKVPHKQVA